MKSQPKQADDFIRKWGPGGPAAELTERAGAQAHFIDLCRLLGVPEPDDPERYCFERGVTKTGSAAGRTDGFADVGLKGHFALECVARASPRDARRRRGRSLRLERLGRVDGRRRDPSAAAGAQS